jgi:hypothetical protein
MEQLRKDGQEDDADLVDASAALDRQWDDFKDENPRGSGEATWAIETVDQSLDAGCGLLPTTLLQ